MRTVFWWSGHDQQPHGVDRLSFPEDQHFTLLCVSNPSQYAEILRKYWKIYYEDLQRDDASASLRERFSLINGDESVALGRLEEDPSIATKGWTVLAVDFLTKADKEKYFDKVVSILLT